MKIVFTPDWFLGSDVLIEIFSFAILALFFILSYKNYKLSKNKKALYLGWGFLLIAIAELAATLTKLVLYYDTLVAKEFCWSVGKMIITSGVTRSVDMLYYSGFFFYKLLTLLGLYVIYRLPLKKKLLKDYALSVYFIILSAVFSSSFYYLFHLTALGLLVLILSNYLEIYKKNKSSNTLILIVAFCMLSLSQIIFLLSKVNFLYAMAQSIQLVSYLILLILIIRIIKHGRQKKKPE